MLWTRLQKTMRSLPRPTLQGRCKVLVEITALQEAVPGLPEDECAQFGVWFNTVDQVRWNQRIEAEAEEGMWDYLVVDADEYGWPQ